MTGSTPYKKECSEINRIASQITDIKKLPEDKRWAPVLHFMTWKKTYEMNF